MLLSSRSSITVRPWRTLLATLALTTASAHAQEQTAKLLKDANATQQGLYANIAWVEPVGSGGVVFPMDTLAYGPELWVSDGTAKGTKLLKDIVPGQAGSGPQQATVFGTGTTAKVAFLTVPAGFVGEGGSTPEYEIWVTDGTAAGTTRVLQSVTPEDPGDTYLRVGTTNGFFFEDASYADGTELLFNDGTTNGTRPLNPLVGEVRKFKSPTNYVTSGAWCYFTANTNEVWRSDGTDAGTTKVATFTGLTPNQVALIGDTLYVNVTVQAGVSGALWKVPAAGGTPTRVGPPEGTTWRAIASMAAAGNELVLVVQDQASKPSLWATDGTTAGTLRIPLTLPGQSTESTVGYSLTKWQDAVYFSTSHANVGSASWRTDGTTAGTTILKTVKVPYAIGDGMLAGTDGVYYLASTEKGLQLWRTQGTVPTTVALKGTPLIPYGLQGSPIITPTASTVYMLSRQGTADESLARMKSTKGGSLLLTRPERVNGTGVPPHPLGAPPYQIRNGNMLEFVSTGRGQELWQIDLTKGKSKSLFKLSLALRAGGTLSFDGTTPAGELFTRFGGDALCQLFVTNGMSRGTSVLVEDKNATGFIFAKVGDTTYFSPEYALSIFSSNITKTDGTASGTIVIKAADGTTPKRLGSLVPFQGALYFISPNADGKKRELWRTDGTPAGTVRVANTWYGDATETIGNLSAAGGKLYFSIVHNSKLHIWQSDGTAAGTVEVTPSTTFVNMFSPAIDLAGKPMFVGKTASTEDPQWWSIGSGTFTRVESPAVAYAHPTASGFPSVAVAGSQLFFTADADGDGELWVTDGTTAGTHLVKDINPGPEASWPSSMVASGNYVHFIASHPDHGRELWRSDGTQAGTVLAADVEPGPNSSTPHGLKAMDGRLYFNAYRRTTGRELYSVDMPQ